MNMKNSHPAATTETKRRYNTPSIINVGSIAILTAGSSDPVGDPPADGTTGYWNSAKNLTNAEADLGDR